MSYTKYHYQRVKRERITNRQRQLQYNSTTNIQNINHLYLVFQVFLFMKMSWLSTISRKLLLIYKN